MKKSMQLFKDVGADGIILAFILFASMNVINSYYYFIFIAFALFVVLNKKYRFDGSFAILLLFALFWIFFAQLVAGSILDLIKPFVYALCYLMGMSFLSKNKMKSKHKFGHFYVFISVISAGPFIHYLLNWIKNGNASERNTIDVWTNSVMSATGQASLACLPLALAIACLLCKSPKQLKFISVAVIVLILGYNLVLSSRTLILLTLIIFSVGLLYLLKESKGKKARILLIAIAVIVLLFLVYETNLFGIKDFIHSSALYDRFFGSNSMDLDEDGRADRRKFYLKNLFLYPFGGANMRDEVGFAHDIFLDTYDEAGIFSATALAVYVAMTVIRLVKCVTNRSLPSEFRQIVLCVYMVLYMEFMIEPILQGMPWLFASFCFIDGYVGVMLSKSQVYRNDNIPLIYTAILN